MRQNIICLVIAICSVALIAVFMPHQVEPPAVAVLPVSVSHAAMSPQDVSIVRSTQNLLQAQLVAHINIEYRIDASANPANKVRDTLVRKAAALGANVVVIKLYGVSADLGQRLVVQADAYHAYLI